MEQFKLKTKEPLEKDIEAYGVRKFKAQGWVPEKYTSPAKRSVPDRIVFKSGGSMFFAEMKRPGGKATPLQLKDHAKRRAMGFRVYVIDTRELVDKVIAMERLL